MTKSCLHLGIERTTTSQFAEFLIDDVLYAHIEIVILVILKSYCFWYYYIVLLLFNNLQPPQKR